MMIEKLIIWFEARPRFYGITRAAVTLLLATVQIVITTGLFAVVGGFIGLTFGGLVAAAAGQIGDLAYKITAVPVILSAIFSGIIGAIFGMRAVSRRLDPLERSPHSRDARTRDLVGQAVVAEHLGAEVRILRVNLFGRTQLTWSSWSDSVTIRLRRDLVMAASRISASELIGMDRQDHRQHIYGLLDEIALVNAESGVVEEMTREQMLTEAVAHGRQILRQVGEGRLERIESELLAAGVLSGSRFRRLLDGPAPLSKWTRTDASDYGPASVEAG